MQSLLSSFGYDTWILPALLIFFVRRGSDDSEIYKEARARLRAEKRTTSIAATQSLMPLLKLPVLNAGVITWLMITELWASVSRSSRP